MNDTTRQNVERRAAELGHTVEESNGNLYCYDKEHNLVAQFGYRPKLKFLDVEEIDLVHQFPGCTVLTARA